MNKKDCYIYFHRKKTNDEIFYVGKGTIYKRCKKSTLRKRVFFRAYSKKHRSDWWKNIVKKYGYYVEIVSKGLTESQANELETFLIKEIGRIKLGKGPLINLTDGGEGMLGYVASKETREKQSRKKKGVKLSEEHKNKIRKTFIGLRSGDKHPLYGIKGKDHHLFGTTLTEETKSKISSTRIRRGSGKYEKNPRAKKVINVITKEEIDCAKILVEKLGIKYSTLINMLKGHNPNMTDYVFKEDYDKNKKYEKPELQRIPKIKIKNAETGEIYQSISEASSKNNYKYGTVYHNIKLKGEYKNLIIHEND